MKNIHLDLYKGMIKEIIYNIEEINEYGLSCFLYGLYSLIDKKKKELLLL
ncbi:hypothetical protein PFDG_05045 [Plasmodium falciparum Dd2]|uniref:Uncharacterized protein n=1 Tax=Plasmodium falciparum (isolate Dd2) TaxID=57267 RepID=A0A0L7M9J8_PLAF4|nr:hypothetical protein PFDG_05045 [Plasmodium falciparum Dd2]